MVPSRAGARALGAPAALPIYVGLAVLSTLFVTKDEAGHAKLCSSGEHWLHAILFALHPIVLAAFAYLWWTGTVGLLVGQIGTGQGTRAITASVPRSWPAM